MSMEEATRTRTARTEKVRLAIMVTRLKAVRIQEGMSPIFLKKQEKNPKLRTSLRNTPYYYLPTLFPLVFPISGKE